MPEVVAFGPFELDTRTGDLRKGGRRVRLAPQPASLLSLLATRPGQLVTRAEIRRHLWGGDVFVDYERSLNACLAHLRSVLGDRPHAPRYIETSPRRGYRFIAAVQRPRPFPQPTVAVLPFANLSGDASLEYFADGMTDALITELASISALRVLSRQTVLHLKGTDAPLSAIARELGVDAVVEGAATHTGTAIRITAQLVAAAPERHLWAQAYECAPSDVVSVHRQVARAVAERVDAALTPAELARLSRPLRVQPRAHEAYLKGLFHGADWSQDGLNKALRHFGEAIEIDPAYAPPHAALGELFCNLGYWGHQPPREAFARAKQHALAALALDEGLGAAHSLLGWVSWWYDWDLQASDRARRRALELGPSDASALSVSGTFLLAARREPQAGIEAIELALKLDPLSQATNFILAWNYLFAGDLTRACEQARATLDLFPGSLQACYVLGLSELALGRHGQAIAAFEKAAALSRDPLSLGYLGHACGVAGRTVEARALLAEVAAECERTFVRFKPFIVIHLGLGETDRALDLLEDAYRARDPILFHVPFVSLFAPLHGDPRYRAVMDRVPVLGPRVPVPARGSRPRSASRRARPRA